MTGIEYSFNGRMNGSYLRHEFEFPLRNYLFHYGAKSFAKALGSDFLGLFSIEPMAYLIDLGLGGTKPKKKASFVPYGISWPAVK